MKISIDFELTPAEAREMFGLPDFSELHQSITAEALKKCQEDPQAAFESIIKPALEQGVNGFSAYQNMMANFMKPQAKKSAK
ncbi:hypothetical protein [Glaciecola sp. SC05]|uniref:hypothetical protein n=1 Tax=Glaciecola sp. SC05 TaxID=1987355 RepID=UPI003528EAEF